MPLVLGSSLDNGLPVEPEAAAGRPGIRREASVTSLSIGGYLIRRLADYSVHHVFGLPGDYVLGFYSMLEASPLDLISCTR